MLDSWCGRIFRCFFKTSLIWRFSSWMLPVVWIFLYHLIYNSFHIYYTYLLQSFLHFCIMWRGFFFIIHLSSMVAPAFWCHWVLSFFLFLDFNFFMNSIKLLIWPHMNSAFFQPIKGLLYLHLLGLQRSSRETSMHLTCSSQTGTSSILNICSFICLIYLEIWIEGTRPGQLASFQLSKYFWATENLYSLNGCNS